MDQIGPVPEPVLPILPGGARVLTIPVGKDAAADGLLLSGQGATPDRAGNRPIPSEPPPGPISVPPAGGGGAPLPDPVDTLLLGQDESASLPPDAEGRPRPVSGYDFFGRSTVRSGMPASAAGLRPGGEGVPSRMFPEEGGGTGPLLPWEPLLSLPEEQAPSFLRQTNPPVFSPAEGETMDGGLPLPDGTPVPAEPRADPGTQGGSAALPAPAHAPVAELPGGSAPAEPRAADIGTPSAFPGKTGGPAAPAQGKDGQDRALPAGGESGGSLTAEAARAAGTLPAPEKRPARPAQMVPDFAEETMEELSDRPASAGAAETAARVFPRAFSGSSAAALRGEMPLPYAFAPFGDVSHDLRRLLREEEDPLPQPGEEERPPAARVGSLRLSEAVRMACLLHSLYTGSDIRFEIEVPWYGAYVRYAARNGLLREAGFPDYNAFATRAEAVDLFSRCVPRAALPPLRSCSLPSDVGAADWFAEGVSRLLRAGVLDYPDRERRFFPRRLMTRGEAAILLGRIATPADRIVSDR